MSTTVSTMSGIPTNQIPANVIQGIWQERLGDTGDDIGLQVSPPTVVGNTAYVTTLFGDNALPIIGGLDGADQTRGFADDATLGGFTLKQSNGKIKIRRLQRFAITEQDEGVWQGTLAESAIGRTTRRIAAQLKGLYNYELFSLLSTAANYGSLTSAINFDNTALDLLAAVQTGLDAMEAKGVSDFTGLKVIMSRGTARKIQRMNAVAQGAPIAAPSTGSPLTAKTGTSPWSSVVAWFNNLDVPMEPVVVGARYKTSPTADGQFSMGPGLAIIKQDGAYDRFVTTATIASDASLGTVRTMLHPTIANAIVVYGEATYGVKVTDDDNAGTLNASGYGYFLSQS